MLADAVNIDLIEELGLSDLPEEKKKTFIDKLEQVFEMRLNTAVLQRLSEEQKKKLDEVLENDGDMVGFLKENLPGFDLLAAEVLANLKAEMVDLKQLVQSSGDTEEPSSDATKPQASE
ncbi:MAG: DUF5663 domain-containing protein [Candidatus Paceibacterota bacterium]